MVNSFYFVSYAHQNSNILLLENRICVFRHRSDFQISDMYLILNHIWKRLRSDAENIGFRAGFCVYTCALKFRSVSDLG